MTRDALISAHLPLVRAVAYRLRKSTLTAADVDDLCGYGYIGLCEAAARFREGTGASFSTFAFTRIQGAIMDGARKEMGVGRGAGRLERVGWDQVHELPAEPADPEADFDRSRQLSAVVEAVSDLPERERVLLVAVAVEDRALTEVGESLGIDKSWASRLRARALGVVRAACASRPRRQVAVAPVVERQVVAPLPPPVSAPTTQAGAVRLERMGGVFRGRTPFRAPVSFRLAPLLTLEASDPYAPSRWREPAPPPRGRHRSGAPPGMGWPGWGVAVGGRAS